MLSFLHTLAEAGLDAKILDKSSAFNFRHRLWFKTVRQLIALAFMLFCAGYCVLADDVPLIIYIIGWAGLAFFGIGGVYLLYKTFALRSRGLQHVSVSDAGLFVEGDLIPWSTIVGFKPMKVKIYPASDLGMLVQTNNNEEIIANTRNPIVRWNRRHSLKSYGAIYLISNDYVDCPMDAFVALCNEYIENDRNKRKRADQ